MPTLNLTEKQVTDLVQQLPPESRRQILMSLAEQGSSKRVDRMHQAEGRLCKIASERGLKWDEMSEEQRETLVNDLVHEDRQCP